MTPHTCRPLTAIIGGQAQRISTLDSLLPMPEPPNTTTDPTRFAVRRPMDARQAVLQHLQRCGPDTTPNIARRIGEPPHVVAHHIKQLCQSGHAVATSRHDRSTRGKPARIYVATE